MPATATVPSSAAASGLDGLFAAAMQKAGAPWPAAIGVSGGSDSLALMLLAAAWAKSQGLDAPVVFCVDHGLRREAKIEARQVKAWAKAAGLKTHILSEKDPLPAADVEAEARKLRYRLMGSKARQLGLAAIYVAHTEDDQAETFLLRLARGSGVDGLSGMGLIASYPAPDYPQLRLVRPLLTATRQCLRRYLNDLGHGWIDDPMNGDDRFARVRVRQALPALAALGLTPKRLAETSAHLRRARQALEAASGAVAARACLPHPHGILVDKNALQSAPSELALRVLAGVLMQVSENPYRPRFERLTALFSAISSDRLGAGRTLHGCQIAPAPRPFRPFGAATLLVRREKGRRNPTSS